MARYLISGVLLFILVATVPVSIGAQQVIPKAPLPPRTVTVTGKFVVRDGGSMAGGQVLFFDKQTGPIPDFNKYTRLPDIFGKIDSEGTFSIQIPPGTYYIGAIKRLSGERMGLPETGDYRYLERDASGAARHRTFKDNERIDLGTMEAVRLKKKDLPATASTAIEGTVMDIAGKPVDNVLVFAFVNFERRPLFVSGRTEKDGKYVLRVMEGTYFLRARDAYGGGSPRMEGLMGIYGEQQPAAVTVKNGEVLKGINIRVFTVQPRGVRRTPAPGVPATGQPGSPPRAE
jgi:hypothetical protein